MTSQQTSFLMYLLFLFNQEKQAFILFIIVIMNAPINETSCEHTENCKNIEETLKEKISGIA